jgi:hypothetical protein
MEPAEPVLQLPSVGEQAVLDPMELVDRKDEPHAGRGNAEPFPAVGSTDLGTDSRTAGPPMISWIMILASEKAALNPRISGFMPSRPGP